ncbi:MAG: serine/threonine protein kinase [Planctomycetes bacterium]|nr:serine/threonine protein kinase [Planctomycetota bacterium]
MELLCPSCNALVQTTEAFAICKFCGAKFPAGEAKTTPDAAPPADPLLGATIGGCKILERIGAGGMGVVYKAEQLSLGRVVAVKLLPENRQEFPEIKDRFQREIQILAKLNHPNIVSILDGGISEQGAFFIMEFVDGISLRKIMLSPERLAAGEALRIIPQICEALEYAHGLGIVHRDIKPENILIDRTGRVRLLDFGLSRIGNLETPGLLTRETQVLGTFEYMAPEQREASRNVDHRADLYSLGVVIYEMLTGELPIGRFDPPSYKNIQVDVRLDEVVLRVLDKSPDRRYQRASELRTEVERISATPPVVTAPPNINIPIGGGAGTRPPSGGAGPAPNTIISNAGAAGTSTPSSHALTLAAESAKILGLQLWIPVAFILITGFAEGPWVGAFATAGVLYYCASTMRFPAPRYNFYAVWLACSVMGIASLAVHPRIFENSDAPVHFGGGFPYIIFKPWIVACAFIIILTRLTTEFRQDYTNRKSLLLWCILGAIAVAGAVSLGWIWALLFGGAILFLRQLLLFGSNPSESPSAIVGSMFGEAASAGPAEAAAPKMLHMALWAVVFSILGLLLVVGAFGGLVSLRK